ncbi:hypothetical protein PFICI_03097 [Pestalotiopsis fici W106-1]|uniref:Uncharacterized protein n=1 Tax=Pestalotiopsis fici (strain W106-1 / CGMCC3.15140) TaxID=1229662 RepID=W3XI08_PESFW|nr:uncharacterized protein PFICI_03097 [Pestalotiopsis fici W106-1]ETS85072.1 hypothetical protein PFICI_03097 [Pestalotiopsis fici W106-1]
MAATFLEYLTQPNPQPIVHTKEGSSTRTGTNYGPDRCVKWEDFTWENLRATLGNVLRQPMPEPRIADASEVPPEKRDIFREDSVTQLAVAWNEPVLRHAFGGTHAALCRKKPANSFRQGKIHFAANTGRGNTKNHKGEEQEPDWCVYQEVPGFYPFYPNIVPGDSKSSKKWKSEWVNSKKPMLRKRAQHVMTQITKYMWESRTRYGFIISEEELVLVRLSVFVREQVAGAGVENLNRSFENFDDEQRVGSSDDDADQISNPPSNASFAESSRKTGLQVEYTVVPWKASGTDILTMNLALWWLPVLAVQGHIIKKSGTYTSLGKHTRGGSPVLQLDQAELDMFDKVYGETSHLRKRKAAEDRDEDQLGIDSCASDPSSDTDEPGPAIHHSYKRRSTRAFSELTISDPGCASAIQAETETVQI